MIDQINSVCFSLTLAVPRTFKTSFISTRFEADFDGSFCSQKNEEKVSRTNRNSKKMNES